RQVSARVGDRCSRWCVTSSTQLGSAASFVPSCSRCWSSSIVFMGCFLHSFSQALNGTRELLAYRSDRPADDACDARSRLTVEESHHHDDAFVLGKAIQCSEKGVIPRVKLRGRRRGDP